MDEVPSWSANKDTAEYQPIDLEIIEGELDAQVHVLRELATGDGVLTAGLFKAIPKERPAKIRYEFEGDETIYIIEGTVTIEIAGAKTHHLQVGDMASFPKSQVSIWTVTEPFHEAFVLTG